MDIREAHESGAPWTCSEVVKSRCLFIHNPYDYRLLSRHVRIFMGDSLRLHDMETEARKLQMVPIVGGSTRYARNGGFRLSSKVPRGDRPGVKRPEGSHVPSCPAGLTLH